MKDEHVLKGELKDIYHRVMNTASEKRDNTKKGPTSENITRTETAPTQPSTEKKQQTTTEPPKENGQQTTPQTPVVATTFAYSSKNPLKPKAPEKPKIPEEKKSQNATTEATKVTAQSSRIPLIAGGMLVFAFVWGVVWALMLDLL